MGFLANPNILGMTGVSDKFEYICQILLPNNMSMFGTLGLRFCIRFKILCLQERYNYVFCCADKEIMFSLSSVGNDSNEITTECVRYITQVCLTKQNVEKIIFMPILYVSYL